MFGATSEAEMKTRHLYAALCLPGAVLPWWPFLPWLIRHGFDVPLFFRDLFANGVSSAFALDLIMTVVVLSCFVLIEGRRLGLRILWAPIAGALVIGVSFGLPLFLYMRESRLDRDASRSG